MIALMETHHWDVNAMMCASSDPNFSINCCVIATLRKTQRRLLCPTKILKKYSKTKIKRLRRYRHQPLPLRLVSPNNGSKLDDAFASLFGLQWKQFYLSAELLTIWGSGCLKVTQVWYINTSDTKTRKVQKKTCRALRIEHVQCKGQARPSIPSIPSPCDAPGGLQCSSRHSRRPRQTSFKGKLAKRSWQRRETNKPGRVRQTLPLLPKLLSNCPDQVWLEAAAAPNVPGKKLKVTILKLW